MFGQKTMSSPRVLRRPAALVESLEGRTLMHADRSLTGTVFCDENFNTIKEAGEPGIGGVVVQLSGVNDLQQAVSLTTTTSPSGAYSFLGLRPTQNPGSGFKGSYKITIVPPTGVTNIGSAAGTLNPGAPTPTTGAGVISNIQLLATPEPDSFDGFIAKGFNFSEQCPPVTPCPPVSITSNFNGTGIAAGSTIWFNSVIHALNTNTAKTVQVTNQTIKFDVGLTHYTLAVPNAVIQLIPGSNTATTTFTASNSWLTKVPASGLSGNVFVSGLAYKVPSNIAGGAVKNITWTGSFMSDSATQFSWQWGAAVYTQFGTNNNTLGVKAVDDNHFSTNSDHAGTPENFKNFVIGGARGGGGSNFTGSYSATASGTTCVMSEPISGSVKPGIAIDTGGAAAGSFVADTGLLDVAGDSHSFATVNAISTAGVTNPAPQLVYQTERYGSNFSYVVGNLTPGESYSIRLHFAETYWTAAGKRKFNVNVNGLQALQNFDIFAAAGAANKAVVKEAIGIADASGKITINFSAIAGFDMAKINGIELIAL